MGSDETQENRCWGRVGSQSLAAALGSFALSLGLEALFLLFGGCFLLIGNGLVLAILPLLVLLLWKHSRRDFLGSLLLRVAVSHVALVSFLIGAGIWLLIVSGFEAQNLICIFLRLQ